MGKNNFFIYTPHWDENLGGIIVLHKLCQLLRQKGCDAYLYPAISRQEFFSDLKRNAYNLFHFVNPLWNTPVCNIISNFLFRKKISDNVIVIYPETAYGNPTGAKNVVRYLMHVPGFHTGQVNYGEGELYVLYGTPCGRGFVPPAQSVISPNTMPIVVTPDVYKMTNNSSGQRSGTAYLVRKGKNKPIVHDLTDSIQIDGKSHAEIAEIFNRVETFISYDAATAYTRFAMLCGCRSVIMLGEDEQPDTYWPNPNIRKHIAWGLDDYSPDLDAARLWAEEYVRGEEERNEKGVNQFIEDVEAFFHCKLN